MLTQRISILAVCALTACSTPATREASHQNALGQEPLRMVSSVDPAIFSGDEPIELEIQAPFASLFKAARKSNGGGQNFTGQVITSDGSASVKVETRGNSTVVDCQFLKLKLKVEDDPKHIFGGLNGVRINTHCDATNNPFISGSERGVLTESIVYKLLKTAAADYFPVWNYRLAKIKYRDTLAGTEIKKYALLIEDSKTLASRYDGELYNPKKMSPNEMWARYQEDEQSSAFLHLFNTMVGHVDYSAWRFPAYMTNLIHNVEVLFKGDRAVLVPYDFDRTYVSNEKQKSAPMMIELPMYKDALPEADDETRLMVFSLADFYRSHPLNQVQMAKSLFLSRQQELLKAVVNFKLLTMKEREQIVSRLQVFFNTLKAGTPQGYSAPLFIVKGSKTGFATPKLDKPLCKIQNAPLVSVLEEGAASVRVKALTYSSEGVACQDSSQEPQREFWVSKAALVPLQ